MDYLCIKRQSISEKLKYENLNRKTRGYFLTLSLETARVHFESCLPWSITGTVTTNETEDNDKDRHIKENRSGSNANEILVPVETQYQLIVPVSRPKLVRKPQEGTTWNQESMVGDKVIG